MKVFRSAIAEFFGTCMITFVGCGCAMTVGNSTVEGVAFVALAYGLAYLGMHAALREFCPALFHPGVSFAALICRQICAKEFFASFAAQFAGGITGVFLLRTIFDLGGRLVKDRTGNYSAGALFVAGNNFAAPMLVVLLISAFFTAVALLGGRRDCRGRHSVVTGLSFTAACLIGVALTKCTCDPAISAGSLLFALIDGNRDVITYGWVYLIVPFAGAALAAIVFLFLTGGFRKKSDEEKPCAESCAEKQEPCGNTQDNPAPSDAPDAPDTPDSPLNHS